MVEYLVLVFVYPFAEFLRCWTGVCAPVIFPWGGA